MTVEAEPRASVAGLAGSHRGPDLRQLLDASVDVITALGPDGTVGFVTPSIARYGFSPEDVVGRSAARLIHPEDLGRVRQILDAVFTGAEPETERDSRYRLIAANGSLAWVEAQASVMRAEDGAPQWVVVNLRDVTAQVAVEARLKAAQDAADEAGRTKSRFLANMTHEIRTPLTAIVGFASLIEQRTDLDPELRRHVDRIGVASQSLLAIINDVLDFSRLEAGQIVLRARPVRLADLALDVVDTVRPEADRKGLALDFIADDGADLLINVDPDRIRQVLLHLIGNAVKFTERGCVTVRVRYDLPGERFEAMVTDTGPGIPEDVLPGLFSKFTQADPSGTRRHGGSGLGLAICRGFAEAMGGEVAALSQVGQGSTFTFRAPSRAIDPGLAASANAAEPVDTDLRILLADDNEANRELARTLLEAMGFDVVEACDGLQAAEIAAALPFDVIMLDLRMPGLDGEEAARRIRSGAGPNRGVPILAFTADADLVDEDTAATLFDGAINKPISPAHLAQTLSECLTGDQTVGRAA